MSSPSTSHGYFESVSTQLSLSVGSSFEGVAGNSSANASQGISAGVSAVDTGMKAGMALAEARNEHAIVSFRYDNMGLPVEERSNEHVIKRTYDKSGQEYRLSDKAGNLFDDPDRKLRKYLRGGKLEQSEEWRFVYDRDGQLVEKYKGTGEWWDSKQKRWKYIWNQNGRLKEVRPPGGGDFAFDALFTYDALGRDDTEIILDK